ncbi:mechanosensitive ion channel family protein [Noviherbaspirillum pedocola]|uniref:Mechanosensitive ion channel family protein n=1 Tax=Noviherbaspirillum pedocola TaxID=2801341 RepID=A0A934W7M9_9BURK|nr:mechanosensitive ion channel family protein [Noviherbaspirillum pedocola]MBK4736570.1 mechanosensitive ion channel family protein [Noviherbaspirillum pedocola]
MFNGLPSYDVMLAATVFFGTLAILLIARMVLARQLRRLSTLSHFDFLAYPLQIVMATRLGFMIAAALLAGLDQLALSPRQERFVNYAWIVVLVAQVALWANRVITVAAERAFERQRLANPSAATHLMLAGLVGRIILWSLAVLVVLDNLGFNITTLMASLGIGGIAVALAVQNILGDIFSSVSIALDKPFVIGDFIVVDSYMGTVEYVGMKTTRLRSLGGEQIVISNNELLKNRIRNYKRMQERRVQFEFGIAHDTQEDQVRALPQLLRAIIASPELNARFDRAHFKGYGESALLYEVVYYVLDPDYNKYMDIQQHINLELLRELRARGVVFARPTRVLYLNQSAPRAQAAMGE